MDRDQISCPNCEVCPRVGTQPTWQDLGDVIVSLEGPPGVGTLRHRATRCMHNFISNEYDPFPYARLRKPPSTSTPIDVVRLCRKARLQLSPHQRRHEHQLWEDIVRSRRKLALIYEDLYKETRTDFPSDPERSEVCRLYQEHLNRYTAYVADLPEIKLQRGGLSAIGELESSRHVPPAVRQRIMAEWEAQGRLCALCGRIVSQGEPVHVDHRVPVALGGDSTLDNLQPAHARCNLRKYMGF